MLKKNILKKMDKKESEITNLLILQYALKLKDFYDRKFLLLYYLAIKKMILY